MARKHVSAVQLALKIAKDAAGRVHGRIEYFYEPALDRVEFRTQKGTLLATIPVARVRAARRRDSRRLSLIGWGVADRISRRLDTHDHIRNQL